MVSSSAYLLDWVIFYFILAMIFVSEEKIDRIIAKALILKKNRIVNARFLAGWVGLVNSIFAAVGHIYWRLNLQHISLATVYSWNVDVEINDDTSRTPAQCTDLKQ